jgi:hypothetical protein
MLVRLSGMLVSAWRTTPIPLSGMTVSPSGMTKMQQSARRVMEMVEAHTQRSILSGVASEDEAVQSPRVSDEHYASLAVAPVSAALASVPVCAAISATAG